VTWALKKLGELGAVSTGSTPPTSESRYYDGDLPFVTPAELDMGLPVTTTPRTLTIEGAAHTRILPEGAVMVCCIGSLGKIGIAGRSVATNQQINSVVFDRDQVLPQYGFYACRLLKPKLESMAPATTVPIVSKSKFADLTIPVPPVAEQWRIAQVLNRAEALRAKRRAALAELGSLTQSIFLDIFGDPSTNSRNWTMDRLGRFAEFRYGTSNKSGTLGKPALRIPNVVGGAIDLSEIKFVPVNAAELERLRLRDGDILFVRTNGNPEFVGRCAVFNPSLITSGLNGDEFIYASYLIRARLVANSITPLFLREYLLGREGRRQLRSRSKTSAGQFNINTDSLGSISIPLPPISLQHEFARRVSGVDDLKKTQRASLAELDKLFASLQHRAFRGEL
jgi:type I restriction enzyme, S subunit